MSKLPDRCRQFAEEFDRRLRAYLEPHGGVVPPALYEAVRYAALSPGKRIRPYLVVRCCELVGGKAGDAWPVAGAVECVHAFSLVHDDLPAMDNDDVRRGQPTTHKKFGDGIAILAGDALLAFAFELIARHVADNALAGRMLLDLATHTGWEGMIGGQALDIVGQDLPQGLELTGLIIDHKTAKLFAGACRLGALVGRADEGIVTALGAYGYNLGRAFQIADDLLDVTATQGTTGKAVAKDAAAGKQTYPRCVGVEQSRVEAKRAADLAVAELDRFGNAAEDLCQLAHYVADRSF